jgi:RNA polymerase sigma-70 factor (ECF subfamily)
VDLAAEAIRLARVLAKLMPLEPEVHGLLGLLLTHHARRNARFLSGDLVPLRDQDRSLWDDAMLAEGRSALEHAMSSRGSGPYVIQAAIASLQTAEKIDWAEIAALYAQLVRLTGSPVIELNRAVAVAEAGSPEAALEIIERLSLDDYLYLHSTRAELLRRLRRPDEAKSAYERALELAKSDPERRFLVRRLGELESSTFGSSIDS